MILNNPHAGPVAGQGVSGLLIYATVLIENRLIQFLLNQQAVKMITVSIPVLQYVTAPHLRCSASVVLCYTVFTGGASVRDALAANLIDNGSQLPAHLYAYYPIVSVCNEQTKPLDF